MKKLDLLRSVVLLLGIAAGCTTAPPVNLPPAVTPVLDAVFKPGTPRTVIARNPSGDFEVLPSRSVILDFFAPWPADLQVDLDGAVLEKVDGSNINRMKELDGLDLGYYSTDIRFVGPNQAEPYWEVTVSPPVSKRQGSTGLTINLRSISSNPNLSGKDKISDPLTLHVIHVGTRPSDVFFDGSENSKRAGQIIAHNVTVAGWLVGPFENCEAVPQCEDWHYNIFLDPDFIQRFYGETATPLASAVLPAAPPDPNRQLPFSDAAPSGASRGLTLNSFLLPLQDQTEQSYPELTVELNGWHPTTRGQPPSGWVSDPAHSDTYWPYDPRNPDYRTNPDGTPDNLDAGDYVIMSGTLWQDGAHLAGWWCASLGSVFCGATGQEERDCWDRTTGGHGGWIELHPANAIVRVRPPSEHPRKTTGMVEVCAPQQTFDTTRTIDKTIVPVVARPDPTFKLRCMELVDGRLTTMNNLDEHALRLVDDPNDAHLEVHVKVHSSGTLSLHGQAGRFKAIYILWWDNSSDTGNNANTCLAG